MNPTVKICSKCNIEKSLTEFCKLKHAKNGIESRCKQCKNEYNKQWKQENPEKYKASMKNYATKRHGIYEWYDNDLCLYVGRSAWLTSRMNAHKCWLKNPTSAPKTVQYLYSELINHPNASIRIVEECPKEILVEREMFYIKIKKPLYNRTKI